MKALIAFLVVATVVQTAAHTLVMVRATRMAEANALATSEAFGFNGDGEPAFTQIVYPSGDTNAPTTNCWAWAAVAFTPTRRELLTLLSRSSQWTNDVQVFDFDIRTEPDFITRTFLTNGLAPYSPAPFTAP